MELLIGTVIIIVLLLILGVSPLMIVIGAVGLIEVFFILMMLFFVVSLILLLMTESQQGEFLRIEKNEGPGTHAVYLIDGKEYDNSFPAEIMFIDKIYQTGKQVRVRQKNGKKLHLLFDWYSIIVIAVGLPVFTGLAVVLGWLMYIMIPCLIYTQ